MFRVFGRVLKHIKVFRVQVTAKLRPLLRLVFNTEN